nr:hypothetical protein [Sedimentibacter sp.]
MNLLDYEIVELMLKKILKFNGLRSIINSEEDYLTIIKFMGKEILIKWIKTKQKWQEGIYLIFPRAGFFNIKIKLKKQQLPHISYVKKTKLKSLENNKRNIEITMFS